MQMVQDLAQFTPIEIEYYGYEIFIEKNPDPWRGDYLWSVSKGEDCFETEIGFDTEEMINDAKVFIDKRLLSQ